MNRKTNQLTEVKYGVMESLKDEAGAIPNEPLKKLRRTRRIVRSGVWMKVVQTRPPVYPFTCDSCDYRGTTPSDMYSHTNQTNHRSYTKI